MVSKFYWNTSKIFSSKSSSLWIFFVCGKFGTMMFYTYIIPPKYFKWDCSFPKYYSISESNCEQEVSPVFICDSISQSVTKTVCAVPCSCLADELCLMSHRIFADTKRWYLSSEKTLVTILLRTSLQCVTCLPLCHL